MLDILLKVVKFAWPYIRESIFGDRKIIPVLLNNWKVLLLVCINLFLLMTTVFMSERAIQHFKDVQKFQAKYDRLVSDYAKLVPSGVKGVNTPEELLAHLQKLQRSLKECKAEKEEPPSKVVVSAPPRRKPQPPSNNNRQRETVALPVRGDSLNAKLEALRSKERTESK